MVQAIALARPGRLLAAGDVLARQPPARDLTRIGRIGKVVDDEDIADEPLHLGGDVGVVLVHVEAVHADAAGLHIGQQLRIGRIGDVPHPEPAIGIAARMALAQIGEILLGNADRRGDLGIRRRPPERLRQLRGGAVELLALAVEMPAMTLDIGDHQIARHPHLVGVRVMIHRRDLRDDARIGGIADIDDGGAVRRRHVADIGIAVLDDHLAAAGNVEMPDAADIAGERAACC